jgi:hypothetical protein
MDNNRSGNIAAQADYSAQLYDLAVEEECAFIDMYPLLGAYATAFANGDWDTASDVHHSSQGGWKIAERITRAIVLGL